MTLSIIIVNYNALKWLEPCLHAVIKAGPGIDSEIIVIDNHSTDGSREFFQENFRGIQYHYNPENRGFGRACNQGISLSKGDYILFLNPDTVIGENCFQQCLNFFRATPDAGAVGVRMTDGSGKFLKESKRGFPSPSASFYKLFGLAKLFPRSPVFSRYYLGNLDKEKIHVVDVLSGAFMMIKQKVIRSVGGFDESYFMYGEDIDLSYRISQYGYKNYYLGHISITHLKGKSTPRSLKTIDHFYSAMSLFVKKHYAGKKSSGFVFLLLTGISIRKMAAVIAFYFRRIMIKN